MFLLLEKKTLLTSTIAGCLSLVYLFFYGSIANATIQQPVFDTSSGALTGSQMFAKQKFIVPPESINTSTITSVTVRIKSDNSCVFKLKLTNTALGTSNSNNVTTTAGVEQNYTFTWTSNPAYHTGNLDAISFDSSGIAPCTLTSDYSGYIYGSATTSSYPNGYWSGVSTTLKNQYFTINSTSTASTIEFHAFPTSTCDFYIWDTDAYIDTADLITYGGDIGAVVQWGTSLTGTDFSDSLTCIIGSQFQLGNTSSTCTASNGGVRKSAPLMPGYLYTATPYIMARLSEYRENYESYNTFPQYQVAEGQTWQFIITGQPNVNGCAAISTIYPRNSWPVVTTTFDNPYGGDWCYELPESSFVEEVKKAFCQASQFLFRPSEDSVNNFYNLKTQLENKPPFGYFSAYSNALTGITTASTTTSTLYGVTSTVGLQLNTWSNLSVFSTLRTILEWVFYLLTGFYIYHRFKNFSLVG